LVIPEEGTPPSIYKDLRALPVPKCPTRGKAFSSETATRYCADAPDDPPQKQTAPAWDCRGGDDERCHEIEARLAYQRRLDAARHAEVERRYRWQTKQHQAPVDRRIAYLRLPELERVFSGRYGPTLPDDDAGRGDLIIAFNHIAYRSGDVAARMVGWARRWAPWLPDAEARRLAVPVAKHPTRWKASTLGNLLRLTRAERERLRIKTIRAEGANKREQDRDRERRKAERRRETRRRGGVVPRAAYEESSLTRKAPWKAEGISRRTWERRRKLACRKSDASNRAKRYVGDTLATPSVPRATGSGQEVDRVLLGAPSMSGRPYNYPRLAQNTIYF
jgi:hypothetical protein